jgi:hypothetical protein
MQLISIVLKISDQTRPPHQLNNECYIFTPNIFNHYQIMENRAKQIIPDSQAVVRYLDPEMLELLDSHGTFIISEILEKMKSSSDPKISRAEVDYVFDKSRNGGNNHRDDFFRNLTDILTKDTDIYGLLNILINGTICNLLQHDGKGWQKGKLKICFEFIPEEQEPITPQNQPEENHHSPLDEIRQLSNELISMTSSAEALEKN